MGERARRRAEFFENHPICCFCGGDAKAIEIDHQPPKIFFLKKSSPRELRVPSCANCNRRSSKLDLNLAFYSRFDLSGEFTEDWAEMSGMIDAFHNNYPTLKPFHTGKRGKRDTLRALGLVRPMQMSWRDVPIVSFNPNVLELLKLSIAKLGVSFFYLGCRKIAPVGTRVLVFFERDILLQKPIQLSVFDFDYSDMHLVKNPNKLAEKQIGVRAALNRDDNLFSINMRLNKAILATVVLAFPPIKSRGLFEDAYTITEEGFPWGVNIEQLLKGKPDYVYFDQNS